MFLGNFINFFQFFLNIRDAVKDREANTTSWGPISEVLTSSIRSLSIFMLVNFSAVAFSFRISNIFTELSSAVTDLAFFAREW